MKILLFILFFIAKPCLAEIKYPVSAIPSSLLKDANVVKRMEDIRFELRNLHDTIYTRKFALTILNEAGQRYAAFVVGYDKLHTVSNIQEALYDAAGNQLRKVKGKDIGDFSAIDEISLYDDNRVKVHDFNYKIFPYTVEYEFEIEYSLTFSFPKWQPQDYEHLAVEQSAYSFVSPDTYTLRKKAFCYTGDPVMVSEKGKKGFRWETKNLTAITKSFASPRWDELTPTIYFAPSEFEIQGFKGNAATWSDLGKFQIQLNENRDKLPPGIIEKVHALTAGLNSTEEKIKKLYEFMQQTTRYVSIQLGIGGLQPFEASFVAQKGYGDCKALSNYMYSLLKEAGIKSYYTWIRAGRDLDDHFIMEDFPFDVFNHIVLCVPLLKDSLWLECTSQTDPPGYMGGFTGNRKALLITEEGGKLVNTPSYLAGDNLQSRMVKGKIDEEGNLSVSIKTKYAALQQDYLSSMLNALSKDRVKRMLNEKLDLSSYEVSDFSYNTKRGVVPEVNEELKIDVVNYAAVSGRRLFVVPNIINRSGQIFSVDKDRSCDYVFNDAFSEVDSVELIIPAGYQHEVLQPEMNLKTKYGIYTSKVKFQNDKIIYYRTLEQWPGRYPAKEGLDISAFYSSIYKADRSKIVLIRKSS